MDENAGRQCFATLQLNIINDLGETIRHNYTCDRAYHTYGLHHYATHHGGYVEWVSVQ